MSAHDLWPRCTRSRRGGIRYHGHGSSCLKPPLKGALAAAAPGHRSQTRGSWRSRRPGCPQPGCHCRRSARLGRKRPKGRAAQTGGMFSESSGQRRGRQSRSRVPERWQRSPEGRSSPAHKRARHRSGPGFRSDAAGCGSRCRPQSEYRRPPSRPGLVWAIAAAHG